MQNKGNIDGFLNGFKQVKNYILIAINAMGCADGRGDSVYLGFSNKFNNIFQIGQRNSSNFTANIAMAAYHGANLSLDPDAPGASHLNNLLSQTNILIQWQTRSINMDRSK